MADYRKARIEDESSVLELMNTAFSERVPHDFKLVSPKVYLYPGYSRYHVVAEEDGELIATIAVLPIKLHPTNDTELYIGYIGNVCSRSDKRKAGHIRRLMQMVLEEGKNEYDLMVLGGQRQLYGGFGFEPGAVITEVRTSQANARYGLKDVDASDVTFEEQTKESADYLESILEIMKAQPFMCERNRDSVIDIAHSWKSRLYAAKNSEGKLLAYICAHPAGVIELGADDKKDVNRVLKAWIEQNGNANVLLPPVDTELFGVLTEWAESWVSYDTEKILINSWQKTLSMLLSVSAKTRETENGSMTVAIGNAGTFRLTVKDGEGEVIKTDEPADITVDERHAVRMFFSSSSFISPVNRLAKAWLPLPLTIRSVDQF